MINATTFQNYLILQERLATHQRARLLAESAEEQLKKDIEKVWAILGEDEQAEARRRGLLP